MKIALMSGSLKNAGDFLIVKRSKELLKHVYPHCEIIEYERCFNLTNQLEQINQSDIVVFAGGPLILKDAYPGAMPLVKDLNDIKPKIFAMGLGWFGNNDSDEILYNYNFNQSTKDFFNRIAKDTGKIGCRDWYSVLALKHNEIESGLMTGCPAWYHLDTIGKEVSFTKEYNKICISDPTRRANFGHCLTLLNHIQKKYPKAKLQFVFHRGIKADENTSQSQEERLVKLKNSIEKLGIEWVDIAYSSDGFSIYDNCDLHIGYRVHAHIYNLSKRNKSILIEEDGRGMGVDRALGLPPLIAHTVYGENPIENKNMIQSLDDYIYLLEENDFMQLRIAYENIERFFLKMVNHLETIQNFI